MPMPRQSAAAALVSAQPEQQRTPAPSRLPLRLRRRRRRLNQSFISSASSLLKLHLSSICTLGPCSRFRRPALLPAHVTTVLPPWPFRRLSPTRDRRHQRTLSAYLDAHLRYQPPGDACRVVAPEVLLTSRSCSARANLLVFQTNPTIDRSSVFLAAPRLTSRL